MKSIFSIKKRENKYDWPELIIEPNKGPNTTRRFLLNKIAEGKLGFGENPTVSFIFHEDNVFMVNSSGIKAGVKGIEEEELMPITKSHTTIHNAEETDDKYSYKSFSSRMLFDKLVEEYEVAEDATTRCTLGEIPAEETDFSEILEDLGIESVFVVDFDSAKYIEDYQIVPYIGKSLRSKKVINPIDESIEKKLEGKLEGKLEIEGHSTHKPDLPYKWNAMNVEEGEQEIW